MEGRQPTALGALQAQVLSPAGPFGFVSIAEPNTQRHLDAVLAQRSDRIAFGQALAALLEVWPFRILSVQPPYGKQGMELNESAS